MTSLFVTFCTIMNLNGVPFETCREVKFNFEAGVVVTPRNCTMNMQISPDVQEWTIRHPNWRWKRWQCAKGDIANI